MKNKTIKKMFEEKINKKEIYNRILDCKEVPSKFYYTHQIVSITAFVFVVLLFAITIGKSEFNFHSKSSFSSPNSSIYINEITEDNCAAYSKKDGEFPFVTEENQNNTSSSFGTEEVSRPLLEVVVPDDLELVSNKYTEEEKVYRTEVVYKNVAGERQINLKYSEKDCVGTEEKMDTAKVSRIKKTNLVILKERDVYRTKFQYQNLYYFIQTRGIQEEEFVNLLESIIKE